MSSFDSLGLDARLLRAIAEQGYTNPTPIQAAVIPTVLEGRDVLAGAQTGTGKTAGFTLPLLQRLSVSPAPSGARRIRALILTPTRELAAQVEDSVRRYGKHMPLRSAAVFGGVNINPQTALLRRGIDVLVATPGRLLDHAAQRHVDLGSVEIFVLDEADRMLDMGFLPDIRRIIALLPVKRQNLLFSATFPGDIRTLAGKLLDSPARIEVAPSNATAERIEQLVHRVEKGDKRRALSWLVGSGNWRQVLVFTRTKHGANRLALQLEDDGLTAAAIHGNKSQGARTRALADFKAGNVRVLVATDIAARGLDIDQLPHVVNYELPEIPEHYVHRIGRTGRAGRDGVAISLVSNEERPLLLAIEKLLGRRIPQRPVEHVPQAAAHMRAEVGRAMPEDHRARHDAVRNPGRRARHGNASAGDYVKSQPSGPKQRTAEPSNEQHRGAHVHSQGDEARQPGNGHRGSRQGNAAAPHHQAHRRSKSRAARRRAARAARQQ
jgi:ATP-dependent RNA helicase RhlE